MDKRRGKSMQHTQR